MSQGDPVKLFLFTRKIGTRSFSVQIPCEGWDDANTLAAQTGMKVEGTDIHLIPDLPIPQFMTFCRSLVEDPEALRWRPHADEQIEAFFTAGWPQRPNEP